MPKGLEDVSKYPHLFATLLESDKWSEGDIAKLAGNNLIRVFKEVEAVSTTPSPPTEKKQTTLALRDIDIPLLLHIVHIGNICE